MRSDRVRRGALPTEIGRRSSIACGRPAALARLVLLAGLAGCTSPSSIGADTSSLADLPPGAVQVGKELYQVPIGADGDGCQTYRLYSPALMVTAAISYRSREGGFTIDRRKAVCDPAAP